MTPKMAPPPVRVEESSIDALDHLDPAALDVTLDGYSNRLHSRQLPARPTDMQAPRVAEGLQMKAGTALGRARVRPQLNVPNMDLEDAGALSDWGSHQLGQIRHTPGPEPGTLRSRYPGVDSRLGSLRQQKDERNRENSLMKQAHVKKLKMKEVARSR